MELKEITDLIAIRQYILNSTDNASLDKKVVNYMSKLLLMVDRKIVETLQSDSFKEYVNYQDIAKTLEDVVRMNDIKSGIRK